MLIISDTNIVMDMRAAELLEALFSLPFDIGMPDAVLGTELRCEADRLTQMGLYSIPVVEADFDRAMGYHARHSPSFNDCVALSVSIRLQCVLLTGDKALRDLAKQEGIEVRGTVWLLLEMLQDGLIDCDTAIVAIERMRNRGRRLPWEIMRQRLAEAGCGDG